MQLASTAPLSRSWFNHARYDGFGNLTKNGGQTIGVDPATNRLLGPSYDANGNQTTRMVGSTWQTLTYDIANRLQSQGGTNEEYRYAPDNRRVWIKNAEGKEDWVFWGPNGKQLGAYRVDFDAQTGAAYTTTMWTKKWFGAREVSASAPITHDRLGSKVGSGATRFGYYPYGEPRTIGGASGGSEFATYTTDSTGLMYADQRYYQSGVGRFATADPYEASGGPADPGSWNRYAYVGGDPVGWRDPSGLLMAAPDSGRDKDSAAGRPLGPPGAMSPPTGPVDLPPGGSNADGGVEGSGGGGVVILAGTGKYDVAGNTAIELLKDPECAKLFGSPTVLGTLTSTPEAVMTQLVAGGAFRTARAGFPWSAITTVAKREVRMPFSQKFVRLWWRADIAVNEGQQGEELVHTMIHELGHVLWELGFRGGVFQDDDGPSQPEAQRSNNDNIWDKCFGKSNPNRA